MNFLDVQLDFFLPVWRRMVLVAFCLCWGVVEFATGAPFWGMVFCGLGVYTIWQFFFAGWPAADDSSPK